ncbi:UNVERIFIED_CONTAM: hypothetical protein GTU68_037415 [Idotea baltica]|nr:hypothetical protein [Idotea baltica]
MLRIQQPLPSQCTRLLFLDFTVIGSGTEAVQEEIDLVHKRLDQDQQLGTGHAAQLAMKHVDSSSKVLIISGDTPLIGTDTLAAFIEEAGDTRLSVLSCLHPTPQGFGRMVRGENAQLQAIVEEKDCSDDQRKIREINTSFYFGESSLIEEALQSLRTDNAQGELYLTDIVSYAVDKGEVVRAPITEEFEAVSGANTRWELSELERIRRLEINRGLMESGVDIEDPYAVYVDEDVEVGAECYLGAGTRLFGASKLGRAVRVEGDSIIANTTVGDGSLLRLGCYFNEAQVGKNCTIGPFVQLRPAAELSDDVKLGNFVEIKKAKLGTGSKANHLSYIGDATIGAGSNIGAGTIFCNYDGVNKHHSSLGDSVFIGSNSTLVSPINVADKAYVAAGSVITENVPSKALALGRSRQTNKEDWAVKRSDKKDS